MLMKCNSPLVIPLIVLMISMINVTALNCYQCRSDLDKNCEEKVHQKYLKECIAKEDDDSDDEKSATKAPAEAFTDSSDFYCRKVSQILYMRKENSEVTIRECGRTEKSSDRCQKISNKLIYRVICECTGAGCNRSNGVPGICRTLVLSFITWNIFQTVNQLYAN